MQLTGIFDRLPKLGLIPGFGDIPEHAAIVDRINDGLDVRKSGEHHADRIRIFRQDLFQELNDSGMTVIVVTHEHDVAEACRRNLVFRDGEVIEDVQLNGRGA